MAIWTVLHYAQEPTGGLGLCLSQLFPFWMYDRPYAVIAFPTRISTFPVPPTCKNWGRVRIGDDAAIMHARSYSVHLAPDRS